MVSERRPGIPRLLRALNDRAALELLLAHGPLTRTRLGELTGLSKVTASQLVERLEERGLVTRVGEVAGGRGPNASLYAVDPSSAYVVGVEVSSDSDRVTAACTDITGTVVGRVEHCTGDIDDPVAMVHQAVVAAADNAEARLTAVRRVVLGTPGLVDPDTGDISFVYNLPRWHRGLLAALREDLNTPVTFENDVNLAAVAEANAGAAQQAGDFVLFWVDVGIGAAIMLGGQLHRGSTGAAGELGYLPVPGASLARDGGRRNKSAEPHQSTLNAGLAQLANLAAMRTVALEYGFPGSGVSGIEAAVAAGVTGGPVLDELARRLALGVASICSVLDPPLVVLAGAVGRAGGTALAERVQHEVAAVTLAAPRVVTSQVPDEPVLAGALHVALAKVRDEIFGSL